MLKLDIKPTNLQKSPFKNNTVGGHHLRLPMHLVTIQTNRRRQRKSMMSPKSASQV